MIYSNIKRTYGLALTRLRTARGISRQQVVNHNEISLNALSDVENGKSQIQLDNLEMLLDYYQISMVDFVRQYVDAGAASSDLDMLWDSFTPDTQFFILDTKGEVAGNKYADKDFERYQWNAGKFGKVNEGDWFIYRRPNQGKKKFYLFGAGQIGKIEDGPNKQRTATLTHTFAFPHYLLGDDDLLDFPWTFKTRTLPNWSNFFNMSGMNQINQEDFVNLIKLAMKTEPLPINMGLLKEESAVYHSILHGDYQVTDRVSKTHQRVGQQVIAEVVKNNYAYHCAVTGVHTRNFLVASHIVPWAEDPKRRLDPSNIICLSTLWDRAFDQGFVTFDARDMTVRTSSRLQSDSSLADMFADYNHHKINIPRAGAPSREALEYHNDVVFHA